MGIAGLPYLVLLIKNLDVSFEVEVLDSERKTRRFRCSNFQLQPSVHPELTTVPLILQPGWNTVTIDLRTVLRRAYGTELKELSGLIVHGSCRIRRIYLAQELVAEENLPAEFKLF